VAVSPGQAFVQDFWALCSASEFNEQQS
jgi:hypothetical protein